MALPSPSSTGSLNQGISHLSQEASKVKLIRDTIRAEDKRLRTTYPFPLGEEWQSVVGLAIYLSAWAVWGGATYAWWQGDLSLAWLVVLNALAISLLHEMEHDLIHELYFKRNPWVQHVMFGTLVVRRLGIGRRRRRRRTGVRGSCLPIRPASHAFVALPSGSPYTHPPNPPTHPQPASG